MEVAIQEYWWCVGIWLSSNLKRRPSYVHNQYTWWKATSLSKKVHMDMDMDMDMVAPIYWEGRIDELGARVRLRSKSKASVYELTHSGRMLIKYGQVKLKLLRYAWYKLPTICGMHQWTIKFQVITVFINELWTVDFLLKYHIYNFSILFSFIL